MYTVHCADWHAAHHRELVYTYRIPRKGRNASEENVENDPHAPHVDCQPVPILFLDDFWSDVPRRAAQSVQTAKRF